MRQLYRLSYVRGNTLRGVTFAAEDPIDAAQFSELWESVVGLPVLAMRPLGQSKFPSPPWTRSQA